MSYGNFGYFKLLYFFPSDKLFIDITFLQTCHCHILYNWVFWIIYKWRNLISKSSSCISHKSFKLYEKYDNDYAKFDEN